MLKRILNNLSRQSEVWVREWTKTSLERRHLRYSLTDRILRNAGERLGTFLFFILTLVIGLTALAGWVVPKYLGFKLPEWILTESNFIAYFGTLWVIQATIVALVYPIVIAFVAVLLRRSATAKLGLRIYTLDAAVLPAGGSSIALLTWMGLQYVAVPYLPTYWTAAAMAGNSAWFVLNSLLTAWFLYRTVRFLNDDDRLEVFKQFAVHVAFPRDVREHLMGLIFSNAQEHKLVPGPSYGSKEHGPKVRLYPLSHGAPCVSIDVDSERAITDIRLRPLAWAVSLWLRRARRVEPRPSLAGLQPEYPLLEISVRPGDIVEGKVILCRVRGAPPPGIVARFLIRCSVVLKSPPTRNISYSTTEILEEVAIEALELAEQRRFEAASEMVVKLTDLHSALIRSGAFISDKGEQDNAALLPDPYGFASRRIHERWLGIYRQLAETAVSNLSTGSALYERHCYLARRLVDSLKEQHFDILVHLLHISGYLMYRLGTWWSLKIEERGLITHDAIHGVELPMPLGRLYEQAMKTFVAGWESLDLWETREEDLSAEALWKVQSRAARFAGAQAEHTVRMLLGAVARGDKTGALWLADTFLKWWDKHQHTFSQSELYGLQNQLLTFSSVLNTWPDVRNALETNAEGQEEVAMAADLMATVLRRYWSDLRLVAILILLDWSHARAPQDALAVQIAIALLEGRSLKPGGQVDVKPLTDFRQVLFRLIRMQLVDADYTQMLDKVVDNAQSLLMPDMVAGRIYSSSGADDVQSLRLAQVQLLSVITHSRITSLANLDSLEQWSQKDLQTLERFEHLVHLLADSFSEPAYREKRSNIELVRKAIKMPDNLTKTETWVTSALQRLADGTSQRREETLQAAKISQALLNQLAKEISDYILGPDNNLFPFSLKPSLMPGADGDNSGTLTISGVSKVPYADPPLEKNPDLDATFFREHVAKAISSSVVSAYLSTADHVALCIDSDAAYLKDIEAKADYLRDQGYSPLLITPENNVPECARPWHYHAHQRPEDDNAPVRLRNQNDEPGIVGFFQDVPAYKVPNNAPCFVVPREDFAILHYSAQTDGTCLTMSATPEANHNLILRFEWMFRATRKMPNVNSGATG